MNVFFVIDRVSSDDHNMFHSNFGFSSLKQRPNQVCVCIKRDGHSTADLGDVSCGRNAVTGCTTDHKLVSGNSCLARHKSRRSIHRRPKIPTVPIGDLQHPLHKRVSLPNNYVLTIMLTVFLKYVNTISRTNFGVQV